MGQPKRHDKELIMPLMGQPKRHDIVRVFNTFFTCNRILKRCLWFKTIDLPF